MSGDYEVRVVSDDDELAVLHNLAVQHARDPRFLCTASTPYPSLEHMRGAHRVYAAYLDGEPVAFMLCSEKRPTWLNGHPEHIAAACAAMTEQIYHYFGKAWGKIENAQLRAAIVAASGGKIFDDGVGCGWVDE